MTTRHSSGLKVGLKGKRSGAGQYGLDPSFQGRSGSELMEGHEAALKAAGVKFSLVQALGDAWMLRFGPLNAAEVSVALRSFVH
jgi:hypothetical protein